MRSITYEDLNTSVFCFTALADFLPFLSININLFHCSLINSEILIFIPHIWMWKQHLRASVDGFELLKVYSDVLRLIIEHMVSVRTVALSQIYAARASVATGSAISEVTSFIYREIKRHSMPSKLQRTWWQYFSSYNIWENEFRTLCLPYTAAGGPSSSRSAPSQWWHDISDLKLS